MVSGVLLHVDPEIAKFQEAGGNSASVRKLRIATWSSWHRALSVCSKAGTSSLTERLHRKDGVR